MKKFFRIVSLSLLVIITTTACSDNKVIDSNKKAKEEAQQLIKDYENKGTLTNSKNKLNTHQKIDLSKQIHTSIYIMWTNLYSSIQQYSHICFTYKNTVYNHFVIFVDDNLKRLPIGQTKRQ